MLSTAERLCGDMVVAVSATTVPALTVACAGAGGPCPRGRRRPNDGCAGRQRRLGLVRGWKPPRAWAWQPAGRCSLCPAKPLTGAGIAIVDDVVDDAPVVDAKVHVVAARHRRDQQCDMFGRCFDRRV